MKQKIVMTTILAATVATAATAAKEFTLENTVYGGTETSDYYPYGTKAYYCRQGGTILYYDKDKNLVATDDKGKTRVLTTYEKISERVGGGFSIVSAETPEKLWVSTGENVCIVNATDTTAEVKTVCGQTDDVVVSPTGDRISYVWDNDLYIATERDSVRVNKEHEDGICYGTTVHRNEFGISGGMFWSPDGKRLCFYRKDERLVAKYPIVDVDERIAKLKETRYPMAGCQSEEVTVGIYEVESGRTTYLRTESPVDRYFTNISWSPDNKTIAIAEINRGQNHVWFNLYDATTGEKVKTLFEETDEEWTEPQELALWTDATHFMWASYRDGYRHLYLYDTETGANRQLTKGEWCVTEIGGYHPKKKVAVIQTNREGYLYRDVCTLTLDGKLKRLSPEKAFSVVGQTGGGERIVINTSTVDKAKEVIIATIDGKKQTILRTEENPYKEFKMPIIESVSLKTADGKHPLTGRMIMPPDLDKSQKYPVIVYVYGGPHSQMVDGSWLYGADMWMLYFAQKGYIVFSMDNRGTEMRGNDFEQAIHRRLGECEAADQMKGVEYLQSLPFVDRERIGVYGWSFGGFMTLTLLCEHPETFKVGIAGGPVCDWSLYEVMYGERYMDTPEENPEGYKTTSILNKIGKLKSRLLVIHGALDATVVWQNSQQLLNKAIKEDVIIDYSVYPEHEHNVRGHDRVHLFKRIERFFDDFL